MKTRIHASTARWSSSLSQNVWTGGIRPMRISPTGGSVLVVHPGDRAHGLAAAQQRVGHGAARSVVGRGDGAEEERVAAGLVDDGADEGTIEDKGLDDPAGARADHRRGGGDG